MKLMRAILKAYMERFSSINHSGSPWEGYGRAANARTESERQSALLEISEARYREALRYRLDSYFRIPLRPFLEDKDVLELGSNHGGASLAYLQLYKPRSIVGLDTTESQAETSRRFFEKKGVRSPHRFVQGYAEHLPFPASSFDAIISQDVFEHVADLPATMNECFRTLRPRGNLLLVFPSFWHPTQHHLSLVTRAPCVHWFFRAQELMDVYWEILDENPTYRDGWGAKRGPLKPWEQLLGLNGTSLHHFRSIIARNAWAKVRYFPVPIGSVGKVVDQARALKLITWLSCVINRIPLLDEISNQRIVYMLTKP